MLRLQTKNATKIFIRLLLVRKSGESHTLPLECVCLGKSALAAAVPQMPHSNKHFNLKRKPKSAALRADLIIKCKY